MISELITELVQQAPTLDARTVTALVAELGREGSALAVAIAQVVELVAARQVDAGIALPALAMACTTLEDARLGEREREAARYEIETLLPLPGAAKPPPVSAPDVPLTALNRGRRPRT